ncbi:MAG: EAL domain-containing protein [Actinomycetota bacterium]
MGPAEASTSSGSAAGRFRHVWALGALLAAWAAIAITLTDDNSTALADVDGRVGWFVALTVAFLATDASIFSLEGRREAHSISVVELPLTIGLVLLSPVALLASRLIGSGVALLVFRRSRGVKLGYNLALFAAETATASLFVRVILGTTEPMSAADWVAVVSVVLVVNQLAGMVTAAAISQFEDDHLKRLGLILLIQAIASITASGLGAGITALVLVSPPLGIFPLFAVIGIFIALRNSTSQLQRLQDLSKLYEFTGAVGKNLHLELLVAEALAQARMLLRAERAQLVVLDSGSEIERSEYFVDDQGRLSRTPLSDAEQWRTLVPEWGPELIDVDDPERHFATTHFLGSRGIDTAVVAKLDLGTDLHGLFLVANRRVGVEPFREPETELLAAFVNHVAVTLSNGLLLRRLSDQAVHDSLTGLPNRVMFEREIGTLLDDPTDRQFAVLLMDLDRFKEVNDTLGHQTGDLVLQEVAIRIRSALRPDDLVARMGGDEFALLLPRTGRMGAGAVADRILDALHDPIEHDGMTIAIGASIGIATAPQQGTEAGTLLARADVAMYAAKRAHVGWRVYDPSEDTNSPRRLSMSHDLREAIGRSELDVAYQPIFDPGTGQVAWVEALTRWHHPKFGPVATTDVIDLTDQLGLLRQLTRHVLDESLRQAARWRDAGHDVGVAVNLTARDLSDPAFTIEVSELLARHGTDPGVLHLELTESMLLAEPEATIPVLESLNDLGVRLAVDDFGTGYSSLSYLRRLPIHELKIDRSFVIDLTNDDRGEVVVRSIVDLGHALGLRVVAEGVEDERIGHLLDELGCDLVQGFAFARPFAADRFLEWMEERQDTEVDPRRRQDVARPAIGS